MRLGVMHSFPGKEGCITKSRVKQPHVSYKYSISEHLCRNALKVAQTSHIKEERIFSFYKT